MHYGDTYLSAITLNTVKLRTSDKIIIAKVFILCLLKVVNNVCITILLYYGRYLAHYYSCHPPCVYTPTN